MMDESVNTTLSVDLKKYRVRLHKSFLHQMGDPEYVILLVNKDKRIIAVKAVEPGMSTKDAHRVNSKTLLSDNSIEIYSGTFVSSLRSLTGGLDHGCSYRLTGVTVPSENMVIFPLDSLERIER